MSAVQPIDCPCSVCSSWRAVVRLNPGVAIARPACPGPDVAAPLNCPATCECSCHGPDDDPGPEHLPTCLWADPDFGSGPPSGIGGLQLCDAAVSGLLDACAIDPDLRRALRPSSDLFELLCRAEAALQGRPADEVIAERRGQVPHGPRLLLSMREWSAVKAREIQTEGVLGSHWPGKGDKLRRALEQILEVCRDRQAFVMMGSAAFAKAEVIAAEALKP